MDLFDIDDDDSRRCDAGRDRLRDRTDDVCLHPSVSHCVIGCDLDIGFLERCHEAVAQFGRPDHLRTVEVADGRTLDVPTDSADYAFSFITLQHCERDDALALTSEAIRVVAPGGRVLLNFRAHGAIDVALLPLGAAARTAFRMPGFGPWLSQRQGAHPTRLAGQPAGTGGRRRVDLRRHHRRRGVAQPAAIAGRRGRHRSHVRGHQPQSLVARRPPSPDSGSCQTRRRSSGWRRSAMRFATRPLLAM